MFGVDTTEFIIVAIAALLFIGPKDLPDAMRTVGRFIGKIRGMARHFNTGLEAMIREAELEEMEKHWREENERIMREYPALQAQVAAETQDQPALPFDGQQQRSPDDQASPPRELP